MTTKSGKQLSKIGIGTYGIGGRGHRNMALTEKDNDELYLNAIVYTLQKGFNFTEVSMGYGHGEAMRLFAEALKVSNFAREDLFITHSLYLNDLSDLEAIHKDVDSFYRVMDTDYADSTLVTQSVILEFGEHAIYELLHNLLDSGKSRYVSLSNASVDWIKKFKAEFDDAFFAHEGHLSFEIRALQDKGIFGLCDDLDVRNIIWRPLGRKSTLARDWTLLKALAGKYDRTVSQIVLNWMVHLDCMPMVFSTSHKHIDENYEATEFAMLPSEYDEITNFRPDSYLEPSIDWEGQGIDMDIVGLISNFEQNLKD